MTSQERVVETVKQICAMFPERKEAVYKRATPLNTKRVLDELTDMMGGLPSQVDLWNKDIKNIEDAMKSGDVDIEDGEGMINLLNRRIRMFNKFKRQNGYYPTFEEVGVSSEYLI